MRRLLVVSCVSAFGLVLAGAAPTAPKPPPGQLVVVPFPATPGRNAGVELTIRSLPDSAAPAREVIYVPAGYRLNVRGRPGALIGDAGALYHRPTRPSALGFSHGRVKRGNPAKLPSDASARACAPGPHAGVWLVTVRIRKRTVAVRFYVDRTSGAETALGAYRLIVCFASPYLPAAQGGAPGGLRFIGLDLSLFRGAKPVFTSPAAPGTYTWRMLVTPYRVGGRVPDPSATFEARTRVVQPQTLTLRARYQRRTKTLLMSGRLLALGKPRKGVRIRFYVGRQTGNLLHFGKIRTRANGRFALRRRVSVFEQSRVLNVGADTTEVRGPCVAPSAAPAGCVDENLSPPPFVATTVVIPGLSRR